MTVRLGGTSAGLLGFESRQPLVDNRLVELDRLTLLDRESPLGTLAETGSETVTVHVGHELGLSVDDLEGAFVTSGNAEAAAVALRLVDPDDLAFHGVAPLLTSGGMLAERVKAPDRKVGERGLFEEVLDLLIDLSDETSHPARGIRADGSAEETELGLDGTINSFKYTCEGDPGGGVGEPISAARPPAGLDEADLAEALENFRKMRFRNPQPNGDIMKRDFMPGMFGKIDHRMESQNHRIREFHDFSHSAHPLFYCGIRILE